MLTGLNRGWAEGWRCRFFLDSVPDTVKKAYVASVVHAQTVIFPHLTNFVNRPNEYSVLLPYLCSGWTPYTYNAVSYWPNSPFFYYFFFLFRQFFLNVGEFPRKKQIKQSVAKCCRVGPRSVLANFVCLSCKYIYRFIKACAATKWAMPKFHHILYLNVGRVCACECVCVCVCVTETGRDLFMHNKSVWLIMEDVWNLFAFRDGVIGALEGKRLMGDGNILSSVCFHQGCLPSRDSQTWWWEVKSWRSLSH